MPLDKLQFSTFEPQVGFIFLYSIAIPENNSYEIKVPHSISVHPTTSERVYGARPWPVFILSCNNRRRRCWRWRKQGRVMVFAVLHKCGTKTCLCNVRRAGPVVHPQRRRNLTLLRRPRRTGKDWPNHYIKCAY